MVVSPLPSEEEEEDEEGFRMISHICILPCACAQQEACAATVHAAPAHLVTRPVLLPQSVQRWRFMVRSNTLRGVLHACQEDRRPALSVSTEAEAEAEAVEEDEDEDEDEVEVESVFFFFSSSSGVRRREYS